MYMYIVHVLWYMEYAECIFDIGIPCFSRITMLKYNGTVVKGEFRGWVAYFQISTIY